MKHSAHDDDSENEVPKLTAPWSDRGWYSVQSRRRMDPEIRKLILAAGKGRRNPILYFEGIPALAWSPAAHNPYLTLVAGAVFLFVAAFFIKVLGGTPWAAVLVAGFFGLCGLWIWVHSIIRIPSWHRARRDVRRYVERTGVEFPRELRWYT